MDEKLHQLQDKEHRSVFVQVCLVLSNFNACMQVKNLGHSIRLFIMSMGQKNQNLILDLLLWALVLVVSRSPNKAQKELLLQAKELQLSWVLSLVPHLLVPQSTRTKYTQCEILCMVILILCMLVQGKDDLPRNDPVRRVYFYDKQTPMNAVSGNDAAKQVYRQ